MARTALGWLCAAALLLAPAAQASEGGGSKGCPWAQDVKLNLNGKSITVPQTIFDPKNSNPMVDGYELRPNLEALTLRIVGPRGEEWRAALTLLAGGKRCTAFYVGRATPVEGDGPSNNLAER